MRPQDFNLPHPEFRPYQLATILWLQNRTGNLVLQAPTGSGKSSLATSMTKSRQVVSLVQTKSLQVENYGKVYRFDVLMGKGNYRCVHPKGRQQNLSCRDCLYPKKMFECPFHDRCGYLMAKSTAYNSNRASVNYAYYLTTRHFRKNPPEVLVMDECHLLSNVVLNHVGVRVTEKVQSEFNLPIFPNVLTKDKHFEDGQAGRKALPWVLGSMDALKEYVAGVKAIAKSDDVELQRKIYKAENLQTKLTELVYGLEEYSELWFVHSGGKVLWDTEQDAKAPGIIIKPFSARFHFPQLFLQGPTALMMSATIGNTVTFANELGISDFQFQEIPQVYSAPIYDLQCPKLNKDSKNADFDRQADIIGKTILELDSAWSGIIHVNSKHQALELSGRLARHLQGRVCCAPELGTDKILQWWEFKRKKEAPNSIVVAWSLWEGVDLLNDKICIVAKIPYASLGDAYTQLRAQRNPQFYKLETAWKLVQGLGRIRRGRVADYEPGANFVSIADGNYAPLLPYIDDSVKRNIVTL